MADNGFRLVATAGSVRPGSFSSKALSPGWPGRTPVWGDCRGVRVHDLRNSI
jgi:hypothetical protein